MQNKIFKKNALKKNVAYKTEKLCNDLNALPVKYCTSNYQE